MRGKSSRVRGLGDCAKLERLEDRLLLTAGGASAAIQLFQASPALFVENQGQWEDAPCGKVRYAFHGSGANIAFTDAGPVFQVFRQAAAGDRHGFEDSAEPVPLGPGAASTDGITEMLQFSVTFVGANAISPIGLDLSESYFNYCIGDQARWRENVPAYQTIAYMGLYDGIDLFCTVCTGRRDSLKYEFHIAPGADYRQIRIRYDGIEGLSIDDDGSLQINLGDGWQPLVDDAPLIYQDLPASAGQAGIDGRRTDVAGGFALIDASTCGFAVTGEYDPLAPLVIDPVLAWSTYLGGTDDDYGFGIAVDSSGNALVTGYTRSSGWISGGFDTSFNGGWSDVFVVKLNPAGGHVWSTYLGGTDWDEGCGIAVDSSGSALVTGWTVSSGWTSGGFDTTYNGGQDAFAAKLSPSGAHVWSTYLGGNSFEHGQGIAVDALGNALVTGYTYSPGWTSGGFDTTHNGAGRDAFVVSVSATGAHLWSTYLGGTGVDDGWGIAVDASGNALVTGNTDSSGWISGGFGTSYNGGEYDGFVVKLSPTGAHLWSTYLGGSGREVGRGIAVDASGNALVTGSTGSSGWTSVGFDTTYNGGEYDGFVVKLSPTGGHVWSTYLGGMDVDCGYGIAVDASGNALVTGNTDSSGWTSGGFDTSHNGGYDALVAKLSPTGAHLWSSYLGGAQDEQGLGIAVDAFGNALVTGYTESPAWTSGGFDTSFNGSEDAFVCKIHAGFSAMDDLCAVVEDSDTRALDVLANDTGANPGDVIRISGVGLPAHGVASFSDERVFYTPFPDYYGPDSFTYTIADDYGATDTGTVFITVVNVNDVPDAVDDSISVDEDSGATDILILANDTYLPDPPETLTVVDGTVPAHGMAAFVGDKVRYQPRAGFYGTDSFTYTISDGSDGFDTATVTVTVVPVTPLEGDADLDGEVSFFDYLTVKAGFGIAGGATWADGDSDADGDVDFLDYLAAKENFGRSVGGEAEVMAEEGLAAEGAACGERCRAEDAENIEHRELNTERRREEQRPGAAPAGVTCGAGILPAGAVPCRPEARTTTAGEAFPSARGFRYRGPALPALESCKSKLHALRWPMS